MAAAEAQASGRASAAGRATVAWMAALALVVARAQTRLAGALSSKYVGAEKSRFCPSASDHLRQAGLLTDVHGDVLFVMLGVLRNTYTSLLRADAYWLTVDRHEQRAKWHALVS